MYFVTLRARGFEKKRKYQKEAGAMRAIRAFLVTHQHDNIKLVTLISPGQPVRTFTDAAEIIEASPKRRAGSTQKWTSLKFSVFAHHGNQCMCCGNQATENMKLEVDHIFPVSQFPELELEFHNLQVLCGDCNRGKSNTYIKDFRPREFRQQLADIFKQTYTSDRVATVNLSACLEL